MYSSPAIRRRLTEFLGGDTLDHATAVYLTRSDGCFGAAEFRPPSELDWYLGHGLDIARSLADSASLLLHLDVEYVNYDSPAEAFLDPWRVFDLQEPVVNAIEALLLEHGIRPLHVVTGQGHHFVWRVARGSEVARRLVALCPAPELVEAGAARVPGALAGSIDAAAQRAFGSIGLLMEHVAHRVLAESGPRCAVPVEITAVQVRRRMNGQREAVSLDISEYGDPLHARMIRMPFTQYLKPWATGLAKSLGIEGEIPRFTAIPLHEMDIRQAIKTRQVEPEVLDLARRACVRIPEQAEGTARLLDAYLASPLRRFHEWYYSDRHDPREKWPSGYDATPPHIFPACARHIVEWPNDLLLKPAGIQLVARCLLADGWHPRHVAGFVRSKFENPAFNWGVDWRHYDPAMRADLYVRLFAGMMATGLDDASDLTCASTADQGLCTAPDHEGCGLDAVRRSLQARMCPPP